VVLEVVPGVHEVHVHVRGLEDVHKMGLLQLQMEGVNVKRRNNGSCHEEKNGIGLVCLEVAVTPLCAATEERVLAAQGSLSKRRKRQFSTWAFVGVQLRNNILDGLPCLPAVAVRRNAVRACSACTP